MRGHTRRHHIESLNYFNGSSNQKAASEETISWREAAKEIFGDTPRAALNLRGLRNREGLTQAQLGEAIDVDQSNISKMERGVRKVGYKIAKKLEQFFNIDYRLFL